LKLGLKLEIWKLEIVRLKLKPATEAATLAATEKRAIHRFGCLAAHFADPRLVAR